MKTILIFVTIFIASSLEPPSVFSVFFLCFNIRLSCHFVSSLLPSFFRLAFLHTFITCAHKSVRVFRGHSLPEQKGQDRTRQIQQIGRKIRRSNRNRTKKRTNIGSVCLSYPSLHSIHPPFPSFRSRPSGPAPTRKRSKSAKMDGLAPPWEEIRKSKSLLRAHLTW